MAQLRIEGFPDDLLRDLKIQAAKDSTTVKAIMTQAAISELHLRRKAGAK